MKRTMSPRIGILGANTFSTDGSGARKLDTQPSNTVNKTLKSIEVSPCFCPPPPRSITDLGSRGDLPGANGAWL